MELNVHDVSDLDDFLSTYGDCPTYTLSTVLIHAENVTSLVGLEGLTEVTGKLEIFGTGLTNLDGLQNLYKYF